MLGQHSGVVPAGLQRRVSHFMRCVKKWWWENTPSLRRGSSSTHTHRLALVQVGGSARERSFGALVQRAERNGLSAAVRGEACGALGVTIACRDGEGGDARGQGDGSDEGNDGFLEEHCLRM